MKPDLVVADGKLRRFDGPDEKPGKHSGWYVLYGDGLPAGAFGNWRTDLNETWCAKFDHEMTGAERAAHRQRMQATRAAREAEETRDAETARAAVARHWAVAGGVHADHAYVVRRSIRPYGAKQLRDAVLVPLRDSGGVLHSAQYIQPDGTKRFKSGGRVAGCSCAIGGAPKAGDTILIAEGWATGCSLHESTGYPVLAAMNAGNLLAVARAVRASHSEANIVVCAVDDWQTQGNPGLTRAHEAAHAVGGMVAVPDFGASRAHGMTDFNDLHRAHSADAVRACVKAAIKGAPQLLAVADETPPITASFPDLDERPCWRVCEDWQTMDGKTMKPGVYYLDALRVQTDAVKVGNMASVETMLMTQANTLDLLFNPLARNASYSEYLNQF